MGMVALFFIFSTFPWPAWPEFAGLPVNPELVVPGLFGLVTLVDRLETTAEGVSVVGIVAVSIATAQFTLSPVLAVLLALGLPFVVGRLRRDADELAVLQGVLGVLTLAIATLSLSSLATGTTGGVFFGGLFTLATGCVLAVLVLAEPVLRSDRGDGRFAAGTAAEGTAADR